MWMKDTRSTRIFSTVLHKHKYITNPDITPKEQVIAATGKLANALKGRMTPYFSETILQQLDCIMAILKHERTQTVQPNPTRIPPNLPPPPPPNPPRLHPSPSRAHT